MTYADVFEIVNNLGSAILHFNFYHEEKEFYNNKKKVDLKLVGIYAKNR